MSDGHTKSKKEASCNEHAEVYRDALQNNAENHDQAANDDSPTTAQHISCVGDTWKRNQGANGHDAGEQAQERSFGMVEVWRLISNILSGMIIERTYNPSTAQETADR